MKVKLTCILAVDSPGYLDSKIWWSIWKWPPQYLIHNIIVVRKKTKHLLIIYYILMYLIFFTKYLCISKNYWLFTKYLYKNYLLTLLVLRHVGGSNVPVTRLDLQSNYLVGAHFHFCVLYTSYSLELCKATALSK